MTKTEICNIALSFVQNRSINNIDNSTEESAIVCRQFFDIARKFLLQRFDWEFTIKQVEIEDYEDSEDTKYRYKYELPSDFLKIKKIQNFELNFNFQNSSAVNRLYSNLDTAIKEYKVVSNYLYCNIEDVNILYIADIEDTELWNINFINIFTIYLAIQINSKIGKDDFLNRLMLMYNNAIKENLSQELQKNKERTVLVSNPFVTCRGR